MQEMFQVRRMRGARPKIAGETPSGKPERDNPTRAGARSRRPAALDSAAITPANGRNKD